MVPQKRAAEEVVENCVNEFPFEQKHKKQRRENHSKKDQRHQQVGPPATIMSASQLRKLLTDYNDASKILHGVQSFKEFLKGCLSNPDEDAHVREEKLHILSEYLNTQNGGREGSEAWNDLLQAWSFALQSNNNLLLSWIPTVLEQLLKITSTVPNLKRQGFALARSIIDASYMKIFYRALTQGSDSVTAPCLRLLTEINKYDDGSLCPSLHQTFDFTVKDIGKKLEPKKQGDKVAPLVENPDRPSVRTVFVRFIMSFLRHGTTSVRTAILGVRAFATPLFKFLKYDIATLVKEVLETLSIIVSDKDIAKAVRSNFFNEWALLRIADLYKREDSITVDEKEQDISDLCHRFLLSLCTKPGNGICFQDSGWFGSSTSIASSSEKTEDTKGGKQVHNRALSNFVSQLRPHADELHLDLIVAIFRVCPELVAKYFKDTESFSFDPKLTATWIGFCTFLSEVIRLPVERGFNPPRQDQRAPLIPPSASTILENVLPRPLTRVIATKCLAHDSHLVRFLTIQLLNLSFLSLSAALACLDSGAADVDDPSQWENVRFTLVEEFCKSIPEMAPVFQAFNTTPEGGELQKEAVTKLLKNYYDYVPEVALAHKFDLSSVLTKALENSAEAESGLDVLVLKNLLSMAEDVPDIKWWNKSAAMKYSPFVSVIKFSISGESYDLNAILASFAKSSYLFQPETLISPLDALLRSLRVSKDGGDSEAVLQYLDDCSMRCVRTPFKYVDDYAELAIEAAKKKNGKHSGEGTRVYVKPVSPLLMVLAEQWKFLFANDKLSEAAKESVQRWLAYFMECCYFLGENPDVLTVLTKRLVTKERPSIWFQKFLDALEKWENHVPVLLTEQAGNAQPAPLAKCIQSWIGSGATINLGFTKNRYDGVLSLLDLGVLCRTSAIITLSQNPPEVPNTLWDAFKAEFAKYLREKKHGDDQRIKRFLQEIAEEFSWIPKEPGCTDIKKRLPLDLALTECMAMFESADNLQLPTAETFLNYYVTFCSNYQNGMSGSFARLVTLYISKLLRPDVIEQLIDRSAYLPDTVIRSAALEASVSILMSKVGHLPPSYVHSLIVNFSNLPDSVYDIVTDNITVNERSANLLEQNFAVVRKHFFAGPARTRLACKIMSLVPALLPYGQHWVSKGECDATQHLAQYMATALKQYTVFNDETKIFEWKTGVEEQTKSGLETLFQKIQSELAGDKAKLASALNDAQVLFLLERAPYVFTSVDMDMFLKGLTGIPSVDALRCYESFYVNNVDRKSFGEALTASATSLTRSISNPESLSKELAFYARELGDLILRRDIPISEFLPRAIINALLEASLTEKIDVPEIDYLVAAIISQCSARDLDHGKFLQLILSHARSPLPKTPSPDATTDYRMARVYLAFAVDRLFSFHKAGHSSITTLDGAFAAYRATSDPIDQVLLNMMIFIEGHLSRSCAARISQWKLSEKNVSADTPLVSRDGKGHLRISFDPAMVKRSMWKFHPTGLKQSDSNTTLQDFVRLYEKSREKGMDQVYDLRFFIPAVTHCLVSETQEIDLRSLIEKNCVGLVIVGLSSDDGGVRSMSEASLGAVTAKLESSNYRERTQVQHLLGTVLASLDGSSAINISKEPIPTVITTFLANCVSVLTQPTHFLYEKIMNMLLRKPFIDFNDIPILHSLLTSQDDTYQKDVGWMLRILSSGLKTEKDLNMYSKRKIFEFAQSMYLSPNVNSNAKEKILEMLWAAADVDGGATTLITRNGALTWISQALVGSTRQDEGERLLLKRLAARLYEGSAKEHVKEWSGGGVRFVLENIMKA